MKMILLAAAGLALLYGAFALATVPTYDEDENPVSDTDNEQFQRNV